MLHLHGHTPGATTALSKPDARGGRRHWSIAIQGATLTTRAWLDGKAAKATSKTCPDKRKAADEYRKTVRAKIRDGYAYVRDRHHAEPGAIVFAGFASGGGGGRVLDLSPDGLTAVTAGHAGAPTSVWVELIDTTTGERRTVFERQHPTQLFLHSAHFDHTGKGLLVTVDDRTLHLDIDSGQTRELASYRESHDASFNPHVLRPCHDQARRRFVLFDRGTVVRVVDEHLVTLLEVPMKHPTTECRAAAISPSGRLLALHRLSRGLLYSHDDARHDATCAVDIWDIDTGERRETIELEHRLHRVGFDPRDERLITTWDYAQGPVVHALGSHRELLRVADPHRTDRLATLLDWDWSRDGARFAAAGGNVLRASDLVTPVAVEDLVSAELVIFSADGSLLASYEDNLCVVRRTA